MKPSALVPLITLLAGFAAGWLVKPAATPVVATPPPGPAARPPAANRPPAPNGGAGALPPPPVRSRVIPVPTPVPTVPGPESAAGSKDAAKMLRIVELLGLSDDQQTALAGILKETSESFVADPTKPASAKETLALVAKCSADLEKSLAGLLTPEQAAKFAALRQRERDNRIETKAQRELSRYAELTDLSSSQRDQILAQLRQSTTAEADAIPAAYSLMLSTSVLPVGPRTMPEQSILALSQVAEGPDAADGASAHAQLIAAQRRRLDERLVWLKPILTPAQFAQYEAVAAEQQGFLDRMRPPP